MEITAIILDGHVKSSLAAVRSLGRAGIPVVVGATRPSAMALKSRFVKETFLYPEPKTDQAAFLVTLKAQAARLRAATGEPPVVLAFSDATCEIIADNIDSLRDELRFPLPTKDSVTVAFDKEKTVTLAKRLNINTIPTLSLEDKDTLNYPVVVKPKKSISWQGQSGHAGTAQFIFSAAELEKTVAEMSQTSSALPLVQSLVRGQEYGFEAMCQDGEVLASFMHQRIRSLSPTGGAAVVKQTAPAFAATETMRAQSEALIKALHWTGPIMVEWKLEAHTDTPYLMEINGRFWGSLPLAVKAGINFPLYYYWLATGHTDQIPQGLKPQDVRTRHFWGDVKWLKGVLFDRTALRPLLYPPRFDAVVLFVAEFFRSQGDIAAGDDSWPGLVEIIDIVKR